MPRHPYVVCDVFTDRPLTGNQLAVFTDGSSIADDLLVPLAREMAFSETVFVLPPAADGDARIRIFTPRTELPFAGHPVLGTAVFLGGRDRRDEITLETGAGLVPVRLAGGFGRMDQPVPTVTPFDEATALLAALRVEGSALPVEMYDNGMRHVYVTLADGAAVAAVEPDLAEVARLLGARGVSCIGPDGSRWKTRMFVPGAGIAEDAATGSAAGPLALHLARHGRIAFGQEIEISQGAEIDRPSTLFARVEGSSARVTRVEVGGSAVVVAEGAFNF